MDTATVTLADKVNILMVEVNASPSIDLHRELNNLKEENKNPLGLSYDIDWTANFTEETKEIRSAYQVFETLIIKYR